MVKEEEGALGIISNNINQINQIDIIPLVDNLKILKIFKDEDKEEGDGVVDALSIMLQLLERELEEASQLIKVWSRIEPIELYNEKW